MSAQFHRPVRRPSSAFENITGSDDAAESLRVAHATASALLTRVRADDSGVAAERVLAFAAEHGIDAVAELWADASARSLPGCLWRLYLVQLAIHSDPALAALLYERGRSELRSIDPAVAGAPSPAGPDELVELVDTILRGVFRGDFAIALERAASFCRVEAAGATHLADDCERTESERATELTTRALRLATYAEDLSVSATLWRRGALM